MRHRTLAFEPNLGQTNPQGRFLAHGRGYALFLDGKEVVLALGGRQSSVFSRQFRKRPWSVVRSSSPGDVDLGPDGGRGLPKALLGSPVSFSSEFRTQNSELSPASSSVRLRLVGANPHPELVGLDKLKGKSNYFIGNDPKKWRTNVPNYARVLAKDVYPGIDQIFHGEESGARSRESSNSTSLSIRVPTRSKYASRRKRAVGNWKMENGN
jgi:hypothetical protein